MQLEARTRQKRARHLRFGYDIPYRQTSAPYATPSLLTPPRGANGQRRRPRQCGAARRDQASMEAGRIRCSPGRELLTVCRNTNKRWQIILYNVAKGDGVGNRRI